MAPTGIKLPDIRIDRTLMRGIFWLLLFLFLATTLASARGVYDRINRRPELRYQVETTATEIFTDEEIWTERLIRLRNGGNGDAQNVYLTVLLPSGSLTRWRVLSIDGYTVESVENPRDTFALTMPRLAPGAEISLFIWASYPLHIRQIAPVVSASFDGGIAEPNERMTSFDEVKAVGSVLARGLRQVLSRLGQQMNITGSGQVLARQVSGWGLYDFDPATFSGKDFKEALLAAAVVTFAAWLFLTREVSGVVTAVTAGLLVWLFTDASVGIEWLSSSFVVMVTLSLLLLLEAVFFKRFNPRQMLLLIISTVLIVMIFRDAGISTICIFGRGNACGNTRIAAGIVLAFWMIIADFIFRLFWRGYGNTVFILRGRKSKS